MIQTLKYNPAKFSKFILLFSPWD